MIKENHYGFKFEFKSYSDDVFITKNDQKIVIPFFALLNFVAGYVQKEKINKLKNSIDIKEILGL